MSCYSHIQNLELALLSVVRDGIRMCFEVFPQRLPNCFERWSGHVPRVHGQLRTLLSQCHWATRREAGF